MTFVGAPLDRTFTCQRQIGWLTCNRGRGPAVARAVKLPAEAVGRASSRVGSVTMPSPCVVQPAVQTVAVVI